VFLTVLFKTVCSLKESKEWLQEQIDSYRESVIDSDLNIPLRSDGSQYKLCDLLMCWMK